jgi:hypothetical protein
MYGIYTHAACSIADDIFFVFFSNTCSNDVKIAFRRLCQGCQDGGGLRSFFFIPTMLRILSKAVDNQSEHSLFQKRDTAISTQEKFSNEEV